MHQFVANIAEVERPLAKVINLGISYGMGLVKLAYLLGFIQSKTFNIQKVLSEMQQCPSMDDKIDFVNDSDLPDEYKKEFENGLEKAQEFLAQFNSKMPYLSELAATCRMLAKNRGWLRTLGNRRTYIKDAHKALSYLIQGSALDQTKQAIIDCYRLGYTFLVVVHDELNFEIAGKTGEIENIVYTMCNAKQLVIPVCAEATVGPNWGDCK
jgi:DNA polymerase I-like protein with 3'-5' exonuclease and polymerase domains